MSAISPPRPSLPASPPGPVPGPVPGRRRARSFAPAAAVAVVLALVAGCSSGKAAPTAGSASGAAGSASASGSAALTVLTPAAKGSLDRIVWNMPEGEPATIDPYLSADYSPNTLNSNLCENLLAVTPDYKITPNLAASWANPDPLTWVYTLRSDVTFWDGSPMTAEDVAFSLNKNLTDASTFYHYLYTRVASVSVTGAHQVTVKLSKPDYLFNSELTDYAGVVVQKKFYEAHPKDAGAPDVGLMCTGPYRFTKWVKGDRITTTAYDKYWDTTRTPKVKQIDFTFVTDEASITNGLLSGQIDGTYDPPLSALDQLRTSSAGTLTFGPHESNLTLVYANKTGPMANVKLRKALQLAIDWDGIATTVLKGTGTPLKALMPPSIYSTSSAEDVLQAGYDALPAPKSAAYDEAKALVAEAGADAARPVTMVVSSSFTNQAFGNAVADAAKRIGLTFTLKVVPVDQYTNYLYDAKTRAGVDILYTDFWPNVPDALDWLGIAAATGGSFNQYGYDRIDDLYGQAQGTKDDVARAKLVVQIQQKLTDELLPMVPGVTHSSRLWMNKRITGAPASFNYVYYPWAAMVGAP